MLQSWLLDGKLHSQMFHKASELADLGYSTTFCEESGSITR
jgi:hypothetical protein